MMNRERGQFFTTNADLILNGLDNYISNKTVMDPFAGNKDLLRWAEKYNCNTSGYDIDLDLINENIRYNDSLKSIPYCDFIITNPPFLAKNRMQVETKAYLNNTMYDDLYMLSIKKIIEASPSEGILILPVAFISSTNAHSIRKEFFSSYTIEKLNYFKYQVFDDTSINVISFYFKRKKIDVHEIELHIDNVVDKLILEKEFDYCVGGKELYTIRNIQPIKHQRIIDVNIIPGEYEIDAFFNDKKTKKKYHVSENDKFIFDNSIMLLNCNDVNEKNLACIEDMRVYGISFVTKPTSRSMALLNLDLTINEQEKLIPIVNDYITNLRNRYHSLFLMNFKDDNRKRIGYNLYVSFISYCKYNFI